MTIINNAVFLNMGNISSLTAGARNVLTPQAYETYNVQYTLSGSYIRYDTVDQSVDIDTNDDGVFQASEQGVAFSRLAYTNPTSATDINNSDYVYFMEAGASYNASGQPTNSAEMLVYQGTDLGPGTTSVYFSYRSAALFVTSDGTILLNVTEVNDGAIETQDLIEYLDASGPWELSISAADTDGMLTVPVGSQPFSNNFTGGAHEYFDPLCFHQHTVIETRRGNVFAKNILPGDQVKTKDNGWQEVLWSWASPLISQGKKAMIQIAAGSLGAGFPDRDLLVSGNHRVLLHRDIADDAFGGTEVFVPAKKLVGIPGITALETGDAYTVIHILCAGHEIICTHGLWTETMFLGPVTYRSFAPQTRNHIEHLMQELPPHTLARPDAKSDKAGLKRLQTHLHHHLSFDGNWSHRSDISVVFQADIQRSGPGVNDPAQRCGL